MLLPLDMSETRTYSLARDAGEDRVLFQLGLLDPFLRAYIDDKFLTLSEEEGEFKTTSVTQKYVEIAAFGLKGWENFKDRDGKAVPFETEEVRVRGRVYKKATDKTLSVLDLKAVVELGLEVVRFNSLPENTEKN